jgi:hypothetical protein
MNNDVQFDNRTRDFWELTPTAGFEISGSAILPLAFNRGNQKARRLKWKLK